MPVIRPITAERGLGGAPQPSVQIDQSVGRAVEGLGNTLMRAANTEQEMLLRREQMDMSIRDFRADQNFRRFNESMGSDLADSQAKMDPSGQGLTANFLQQYDKKSKEFLASVPEGLRPKFDELVQTSRAGWLDKVAGAEREQRYSWFRTGIVESQEKLQAQVFNDPEAYEAAKVDGLRAIDASGLPEAEKVELRKKWDETLGLTVGEREVRDAGDDPANAADAARRLGVPGAAATTDNGGDAMSLLRHHEGFRATPYWDVNAYRVGYGSDTITRADGSVVKVTKGMRVTRADAERDLARRVKEFEATARKQVGAREWGALSPEAQAALVSVSYNYGKLPATVANAVKSGNREAIASAVEGLSANKGRRRHEASVIRGQAVESNAPDLSGDGMDPRYAGLSLSQRLELLDKINASAKSGVAAMEAQRKAVQQSTYDNLSLGIVTGDVVSDQTILGNQNIDEGQKASLLRSLHAQRKEDGDVSAYIAAWSEQSDAAKINPFDSKQTALNDKAYDKVIAAVPEEARQAVADNWVVSTGTVPKTIVADVRQGLNSANPADASRGMQDAARYYQIAPQIFEAIPNGQELKDAAIAYNEYVNQRGLSSEEAGRRWVDLHSPEMIERRERLKEPAKDFVKTLDVSDVTNAFDTVFTWEPSAGMTVEQQNALMTDYVKIGQEKFLEAGGDPDLAKALALDEMTRLYGVSDVAGQSVVMKFPPERYYPPIKGSHDYIREEALADAKSVDPAAKNVNLKPVKETADDIRTGKPPRYELLYLREDGVWDRVLGPLFAVDPEKMSSAMDADRAERIERAREIHRRAMEPSVVGTGRISSPEGVGIGQGRVVGSGRPVIDLSPGITVTGEDK